MGRSDRIRSLLEGRLSPLFLDIVNESDQHSVKPGSETHFKIVVASAEFEGKSRLERQRAVNAALRDELDKGLHALTMSTFSLAEWELAPEVQKSPACLGGSKSRNKSS